MKKQHFFASVLTWFWEGNVIWDFSKWIIKRIMRYFKTRFKSLNVILASFTGFLDTHLVDWFAKSFEGLLKFCDFGILMINLYFLDLQNKKTCDWSWDFKYHSNDQVNNLWKKVQNEDKNKSPYDKYITRYIYECGM